ncbi:MAG: hypothetical protein WC668_00380 [Patescibacteria group bacterium]|jgi:hypothetical protein
MKKTLIISIFILFVAFAFALAPAKAQVKEGLTNLGAVGQQTGLQGIGQGSLPVIVGGIVKAVLGVLGILLILLLIYAGFTWMTAQGNEKKVDEAKKMIYNAVIGLAIVAGAWAITAFVLDQLQRVGSGSQAVTSQEFKGLPTNPDDPAD